MIPGSRQPAAEDHFYVYFRSDDEYLYDRTCGTERRAAERVRELTDQHGCGQAVYLRNHLISGALY